MIPSYDTAATAVVLLALNNEVPTFTGRNDMYDFRGSHGIPGGVLIFRKMYTSTYYEVHGIYIEQCRRHPAVFLPGCGAALHSTPHDTSLW